MEKKGKFFTIKNINYDSQTIIDFFRKQVRAPL